MWKAGALTQDGQSRCHHSLESPVQEDPRNNRGMAGSKIWSGSTHRHPDGQGLDSWPSLLPQSVSWLGVTSHLSPFLMQGDWQILVVSDTFEVHLPSSITREVDSLLQALYLLPSLQLHEHCGLWKTGSAVPHNLTTICAPRTLPHMGQHVHPIPRNSGSHYGAFLPLGLVTVPCFLLRTLTT